MPSASLPTHPLSSAADRRIVAFGRACFGLGVTGLGLQFFVNHAWVAVILPTTPSLPVGVVLGGAVLVLGGLALAAGWKARGAALVLGAVFLAAFVLAQVPHQLPTWKIVGLWTTPLKTLTLAGGAGLCATTLPGSQGAEAFLRNAGRLTFGLMLLVFGIEHFLYRDFVATLVPHWIPGAIFWTYWAGGALMAGGLGLLLGVLARLAAALSGAMIFIWLVVLHLPRAVADPTGLQGNEVSSVCEALAFSGLGFILWRLLPPRAASG